MYFNLFLFSYNYFYLHEDCAVTRFFGLDASLLGFGSSVLLLGLCLGSLTESVGELSTDQFQVSHAASSGGTSALSLESPVVVPQTSERVGAGSARLFLDVPRVLAASHTQGVGFVVAFSESCGSLSHLVFVVVVLLRLNLKFNNFRDYFSIPM